MSHIPKYEQVAFKTSNSSVQSFGSIDMNKPGVRAEDIFKHPIPWLKYRLTGDNIIGTVMDSLYVISNAELIMSGVKDKTKYAMGDPSRIIAGAIAVCIGVWSLISPRGAREAEGNTPLEKTLDIIKHPQESSVQFGWLMSIPMYILLIGGNMKEGWDLRKDPSIEVKKLGNTRLRQGIEKAIGSLLVNGHLFNSNSEKETAGSWVDRMAENQNDPKPFLKKSIERMKNVYVSAVKDYPVLTVARSFLMASQVEKIYEGRLVKELDKKSIILNDGGENLIRSGQSGVLSRLLMDYYSSARLYDSNKPSR